MGKKFKIIYDRKACIGAAACAAVDNERWEIAEDGKADLIKGEKSGDSDVWERVIDEDLVEISREAADSCPVGCIRVEEIEEDSSE